MSNIHITINTPQNNIYNKIIMITPHFVPIGLMGGCQGIGLSMQLLVCSGWLLGYCLVSNSGYLLTSL